MVLEQVRSILRLGNTEMHEGTTQVNMISPGKFTTTYKPASNEAYCNSVEMLGIILWPEMTKDEVSILDKFSEDKEELRSQCREASQGKDYKMLFNKNWYHKQLYKFGWLCHVMKRLKWMQQASVEESI